MVIMINQSSLFSPVAAHDQTQPQRVSSNGISPFKRSPIARSLFSDENTERCAGPLFSPPKEDVRRPLRSLTPPASKRIKEELQDNALELFGKMYEIEQIGSGDYHKVYQFTSEGLLNINEDTVNLTDCVFRTVKCKSESTVRGFKPLSILVADFEGYEALVKAGVPVPKVYLKDVGTNKWGWILEKLTVTVDAKNWEGKLGVQHKKISDLSDSDRKVLHFAKHWFQKMLQDKKEYILDFKPDNVMQDKKGDFKVVDFGEGQKKEEDYDFGVNMRTSFKKWMKENQNVKDYLTDGLSEEEKKIVDLTV